MARRDDKPTSFGEWVHRTLYGAADSDIPRRLFDFSQWLQREFLREPHPSASPPAPENPVLPPVEAAPSTSSKTRRPKPHEQKERAERALRSCFPPGGKTPAKLSAHLGATKINAWLEAETRDGKAPASEAGLPPVSDDVAGKAMNWLGRIA